VKWQSKARIQKIISRMPLAGKLNYFLQRYVNHSLPMSMEVFDQKQIAARQHLEAFGGKEWEFNIDGLVYEFGAGYDLAIPLIFYDEGFKNQVVTDLNQLIKLELVNGVMEWRGMDIELIKDIDDLKQKTGIEYRTNIDARKTGFETASFDYIHSTDTLEHIPKADILSILQECYRLLKPGGIISCIIDLQDHYQYTDKKISPFNFYQYSWEEWDAKYNNNLHYQNRLLANEYYSQFVLAGFAPIQMQVVKADDASIKNLKAMPLDAHYANKPFEELCNLRCHIWAEKPD
jgi:SAM-dependent methyltransferase